MINKKDTISVVKDRFESCYQNQEDRFKRFNDFDYIFHSKLKKYDPSVASKVFNPILWSFIETIVTRMLSKNPEIAYKPREYNDITQSKILSQLFDYWFAKAGGYAKMVNWVKDALIYGTGIVKMDWYTSPTRLVKQYITDQTGEAMVDEDGNLMTQEVPQVQYDDPRLTNVNIYDFYVDPMADSIENAKYVIHQYWTTVEELESQNNQQTIYSKAGLSKLKNQEINTKVDTYEQSRKNAATGQTSTVKTDRIKIWEMWEKDRLVVIANEDILLRDDSNPYWHGKIPFIRIVDSLIPNEFFGKGEIEPVEKQLHALNTIQNQRITNVNRILSPVWKIKPTVDDDECQMTDNNIIHLIDQTDVDFITPPNVTGTAVQEQSIIIENIQRALGVTDYVQGVSTPGQTAKEVEVKTSQANARFAHKIKLFEEMGLKEVGEFVYELYQQFVTIEKVIRVVGDNGDEFIRLTPADLCGAYDVIPESDSTLSVDNEAEYAKLVNLYGILQPFLQQDIQDPATGMMMKTGFIDKVELLKTIIEKAGIKEADRLIIKEENVSGNESGGPEAIPGQFGQAPQGFEGLPQNEPNGGLEALIGGNPELM